MYVRVYYHAYGKAEWVFRRGTLETSSRKFVADLKMVKLVNTVHVSPCAENNIFSTRRVALQLERLLL